MRGREGKAKEWKKTRDERERPEAYEERSLNHKGEKGGSRNFSNQTLEGPK